MKLESACRKILEYLQSHGPTNTYRLSAILKVDRLKLISIIEELVKEGLTEFSSNIARIARVGTEENIVTSLISAPNIARIARVGKEQLRVKDKTEAHSILKLPDASPGKEFHFCNGIHVKNLDELLTALKTIDDGVYQYHANNEKNDFSNWIKDVLGDEELASSLKMRNREEAVIILEARIKQLKG